MAKRPVPLYDFKAFGAAIKAARNEYGESRKKVSDELYISPRYLANIENKGQQPSLQVFYDLVTRYHISVDQFFFPNSNAEKSTGHLFLRPKSKERATNTAFRWGYGVDSKQISVHDFYFRLPFPKLGQIRNLNTFASLFTADNAKPAISRTTPA